jgi:uncharacterized protein YkwD
MSPKGTECRFSKMTYRIECTAWSAIINHAAEVLMNLAHNDLCPIGPHSVPISVLPRISFMKRGVTQSFSPSHYLVFLNNFETMTSANISATLLLGSNVRSSMNFFLLFSIVALFGSTPTTAAALQQTNAPNLQHPVNTVLAVHVRAPTPITQRERTAAVPSPATTTPPTTPPEVVVTAPPPPAQVTQEQSDVASQIEAMIFSLTNTEREKNGLAPLVADPALAQIARTHSSDMLAHQYFNHTDLAGCDLSCRFAASGYSYWSIGENIHMMSGYNLNASDSAQKIVSDWMNSPGHRANMLNASFTRTGVGVAVQGSTIYSTTDFALPR